VYTRIARLALEEKGVPHSLREVEIFGPDGVPSEHLERQPFGRIPVLQHGDFTVYETQAISRYVDEAFPGPSLQPAEPAARARMNQVIGVLDSYAYRPLVWGVFVQRVRIPLRGGAPDESLIAQSLALATTCLSSLARLCGPGPFLVSPALSLADLHAYPILRYFSLAPEGSAMLAKYPALGAWLALMSSRESVMRTITHYEMGQ
jgi:glutathione S-transferase